MRGGRRVDTSVRNLLKTLRFYPKPPVLWILLYINSLSPLSFYPFNEPFALSLSCSFTDLPKGEAAR